MQEGQTCNIVITTTGGPRKTDCVCGNVSPRLRHVRVYRRRIHMSADVRCVLGSNASPLRAMTTSHAPRCDPPRRRSMQSGNMRAGVRCSSMRTLVLSSRENVRQLNAHPCEHAATAASDASVRYAPDQHLHTVPTRPPRNQRVRVWQS